VPAGDVQPRGGHGHELPGRKGRRGSRLTPRPSECDLTLKPWVPLREPRIVACATPYARCRAG
jgi:hypothetical protein